MRKVTKTKTDVEALVTRKGCLEKCLRGPPPLLSWPGIPGHVQRPRTKVGDGGYRHRWAGIGDGTRNLDFIFLKGVREDADY